MKWNRLGIVIGIILFIGIGLPIIGKYSWNILSLPIHRNPNIPDMYMWGFAIVFGISLAIVILSLIFVCTAVMSYTLIKWIHPGKEH